MIRLIAFVRPHRLEAVKSAITALGVSGMTVGDCRGRGNSEERTAYLAGDPNIVALPIRSRLEVVAPADMQEALIAATSEAAFTGEPGDGKLFALPLADAYRIRTGERGDEAI
jgi:nitrogen regulatory protein PII